MVGWLFVGAATPDNGFADLHCASERKALFREIVAFKPTFFRSVFAQRLAKKATCVTCASKGWPTAWGFREDSLIL